MTKPQQLLVALTLLASCVSTASADTIDLRLDVTYTGANPSAGGAWTLYAKTDQFGLYSLSVPLSGVNAAITNELPRGRVNGSATDNAGFSIFQNQNFGATRELFFAQTVTPSGAGQQGVFYGVGTLDNGSPNFPGRVANTAFLGPNITTLASVQDVPWALSDPLWATGVTVATGTFAAGASPTFSLANNSVQGFLLSSIGTLTTPGATTPALSITTQVNSNLGFGVSSGDYNGDGRVDAADYTVWRDHLNQSVPQLTLADGNGDGMVNTADYTVWKTNYGRTASSAVAIPEPATGFLAVFSLLGVTCRRCWLANPGKVQNN